MLYQLRSFLFKKRTKAASQLRSVATNVVQKVCLSLVTFFGKKVTLIVDQEEKEKTHARTKMNGCLATLRLTANSKVER